MLDKTSQRKPRGLMSWSTREILVTAVIGIAFGLAWSALTYLYLFIMALNSIALQCIWVGVWIIPALFAAYVIRKPGASFLTFTLASLVTFPFTPYGLVLTMLGLFYGTCVELAFWLITRYRHYSFSRMLYATLSACLVIVLITGVPLGLFAIEPLLLIGTFVGLAISGTFGLVVAKGLADAIVRTGVLSGTALTYETVSEV